MKTKQKNKHTHTHTDSGIYNVVLTKPIFVNPQAKFVLQTQILFAMPEGVRIWVSFFTTYPHTTSGVERKWGSKF